MTQRWLSRLLTCACKECLVWEGDHDSSLLREWHPQKPVSTKSHVDVQVYFLTDTPDLAT